MKINTEFKTWLLTWIPVSVIIISFGLSALNWGVGHIPAIGCLIFLSLICLHLLLTYKFKKNKIIFVLGWSILILLILYLGMRGILSVEAEQQKEFKKNVFIDVLSFHLGECNDLIKDCYENKLTKQKKEAWEANVKKEIHDFDRKYLSIFEVRGTEDHVCPSGMSTDSFYFWSDLLAEREALIKFMGMVR